MDLSFLHDPARNIVNGGTVVPARVPSEPDGGVSVRQIFQIFKPLVHKIHRYGRKV